MRKLTLSLFSLLLIMGCQVEPQNTDYSSCAPTAYTIETLQALKADEFKSLPIEDYAQTGRALLNCIGVKDPAIRDGLVYETATFLLLSGQLTETDYREYRDVLYSVLEREDRNGFAHPFAALVLAEIARTDRVSPWMSAEERDEMVFKATSYLNELRDYRGFDDDEGWRHGIAHSADWLMQLALNPAITPDQDASMLVAISGQVQAHHGHSYIFGEPERLARPVLFIAQRGQIGPEDWQAFFDEITDKAELESWADAYKSETDLARLHNVKSFLYVLYANANLSTNENIKPLAEQALNGLRALP